MKYRGITIEHGEDGYHASNGSSHFGYCETVEEIREEIDDHFNDESYGPLNGYFTGADA